MRGGLEGGGDGGGGCENIGEHCVGGVGVYKWNDDHECFEHGVAGTRLLSVIVPKTRIDVSSWQAVLNDLEFCESQESSVNIMAMYKNLEKELFDRYQHRRLQGNRAS